MALRGRIREEEWTIYIEENSEVDRGRPSIFLVPNDLKKGAKESKAYIPERVSLGPYHYRSAEIPPMESHKGRAVHRMWSRAMAKAIGPSTMDLDCLPSRAFGPSTTALDFFRWAREDIMLLDDQIRECYAEEIGYNKETLAMMLCFDGCFILEILRALFGDILRSESSTYMRKNYYYEPLFQLEKIGYTGFDILRDIVKLENQIPLIVLRKLLVLQSQMTDNVKNRNCIQQMVFEVLVLPILNAFYPFTYQTAFELRSSLPVDEECHLLGILHTLIVSPVVFDRENPPLQGKGVDERRNALMNAVGSIPRAVELANAGIQFRPCAGGIRGINFDPNQGTIDLPPILVEGSTETLFRNLLAFEMCKPSDVNYVACYVVLMERLIDCEEDVALLRKNRIVVSCLRSQSQVAQLFNGLGSGVTLRGRDAFGRLAHDVFFEKLAHDLSVYRQTIWEAHRAELVSTHFSSAWRFIGLLAGLLILVAGILQTVYTILSYYRQTSV